MAEKRLETVLLGVDYGKLHRTLNEAEAGMNENKRLRKNWQKIMAAVAALGPGKKIAIESDPSPAGYNLLSLLRKKALERGLEVIPLASHSDLEKYGGTAYAETGSDFNTRRLVEAIIEPKEPFSLIVVSKIFAAKIREHPLTEYRIERGLLKKITKRIGKQSGT